MAKIIVWSDLHAHTFKPHSTILEGGLNSRLNDALVCIRAVLDHAINVEADLVLFGGDLFDVRGKVPTQAMNTVIDELSKFQVFKIPLAMIPGNHDQEDRAGRFHSLHPMSMFATVMDKPGWYEFTAKNGDSIGVFALPYTEDPNALFHVLDYQIEDRRDQYDDTIFLGHMSINDAEIGSNFVYRDSVEPDVEQLPCGAFDFCFLGHFHKHQYLAENCVYIGATLQHNWGDKGQYRGFLEYDSKGLIPMIPKQIEVKNVPKFVEVAIADLERNDMDDALFGNFVRVITNEEWTSELKQGVIERHSLRDLKVVVRSTEAPVETTVRLDINEADSYPVLVEKYINSGLVDLDGLDPDLLVTLGQDILKAVANEV